MLLEAVLTFGWPEVPVSEKNFSALAIHNSCADRRGRGYSEELLRLLIELQKNLLDRHPIIIKGTEQLLRRRAGGFRPIQEFVGKLNEIVTFNPALGDVRCEIDVFAYAFLKSAKNFDFFLPENTAAKGRERFRDVSAQWKKDMTVLERFERKGTPMTYTDTLAYLACRRIITRKSARDERRALATLLVSGPSTSEEVTEDLGLPYSLAERILPTFEGIGILERRAVRYVIKREALPRVVFCLREVMGIDLLAVLDEEDGS
jgi:hypothetical protein